MKQAFFLALILLGAAAPQPEAIAPNDNRLPAGTLNHQVLRISLEAATGIWSPDGTRAPGLAIEAFRESGHVLQIPGPLIRVPVGTTVEARLRNTLSTSLTIHGFNDRPGRTDATVKLAPGEEQLVRFHANAAGTYYYWATSTGSLFDQRLGADSQLSGAIVVDDANRAAAQKSDRIFVIGLWNNVHNGDGTINKLYELFTINGRAWPNTERLQYRQGQSVHWRWINASAAYHPLHLHGFYFSVGARGDGQVDVVPAQREAAVTELLTPGKTFAIAFKASRPGNWLFHCHLPYHAIHHVAFSTAMLGRPSLEREAIEHDTTMGGLIIGLTVHPLAGASLPVAPPGRRHLTLSAEIAPDDSAHVAAYRYTLLDRDQKKRGPGALGPVIVLTQGVPVAITVQNRLREATAVHWHGIEMLDSYFDGVPGFSGYGARLEPMIMPGGAFEARFTPPRAGTFIYHTHMDDVWQARAGLTGPLVVLAPGQRFNPAVDHVVMLTTPRDWHDQLKLFVNGLMTPAPLTFERGIPQRIRLINMGAVTFGASVSLESEKGIVQWRAIARDGADYPITRASFAVEASTPITIGQTRDFSFVPAATGEMHLTIRMGPNSPYVVTVPIHVVSRVHLKVSVAPYRPATGGRTMLRE